MSELVKNVISVMLDNYAQSRLAISVQQ